MDIIKIVMIGITGVILAMLLRQQKSEYALYISLTVSIFILIFAVERLEIVMETIGKMETYIHIDSAMIKILIKMIGITYVSEFAAGICKDAGFGTIGNQIEIFAKLSIMAVSVPILLTLIETIEGLFGN